MDSELIADMAKQNDKVVGVNLITIDNTCRHLRHYVLCMRRCIRLVSFV